MRIAFAALTALVLLPGCPDKASTDTSKSVFEPAPTAAPGAIDPHAKPGALPAGHPPTGAGTAGMPAAAGAPNPFGVPTPVAGTGVGATGMTWSLPEGWTEVKPANAMRRAQFEVTGEAGKAECVVFYFGPGQGGDPLSNARRWADQFVQPDGKPSADVMKTASRKVGEMEVLTVEVTGSYGGGMGTGTPQENQMLLGAVAKGPDAPWFFKFTGPKKIVEANRKSFDALLDSLKPGA